MRKNVKGKIQQGRERDEEGKSTHSLHREIREAEKRVVLMLELWLLSHVKAASEDV